MIAILVGRAGKARRPHPTSPRQIHQRVAAPTHACEHHGLDRAGAPHPPATTTVPSQRGKPNRRDTLERARRATGTGSRVRVRYAVWFLIGTYRWARKAARERDKTRRRPGPGGFRLDLLPAGCDARGEAGVTCDPAARPCDSALRRVASLCRARRRVANWLLACSYHGAQSKATDFGSTTP
jgi:hypothetical protein